MQVWKTSMLPVNKNNPETGNCFCALLVSAKFRMKYLNLQLDLALNTIVFLREKLVQSG